MLLGLLILIDLGRTIGLTLVELVRRAGTGWGRRLYAGSSAAAGMNEKKEAGGAGGGGGAGARRLQTL